MKKIMLIIILLFFMITPISGLDAIMSYNKMTSDVTGTVISNATSVYNNGYRSWKAFNGVSTADDCWVSVLGGGLTQSIWQYNKTGYIATAYGMIPEQTGQGMPSDFTFKGSDDLSTWVTLDTKGGVSDWVAGREINYTITNTNSYKYYNISITNINSGTIYFIREIKIYGIPYAAPPNSITGLSNNTEKCNEVKWSWTNPTNTDYNYLYTLKNDVWASNYTNSTTTINWSGTTGLVKFSSKTVNLIGNINASWVNQTANVTTCVSPIYPTGNIQLSNCGRGTTYLAWCYTNSTNITSASIDYQPILNFDNASSMYIANNLQPNSSHIFTLFGSVNSVYDVNTTLTETQTNKESVFSIILIYLLFLLGCICIVIGISHEPIIGFGAFIFGVIGLTTSLNNSFIMGSLFSILIIASIFVVFNKR